jgi:hypothetical protein
VLAVIVPAALSRDTYELGDSLIGMVPFGALAGLIAGAVWVAVRERRN